MFRNSSRPTQRSLSFHVKEQERNHVSAIPSRPPTAVTSSKERSTRPIESEKSTTTVKTIASASISLNSNTQFKSIKWHQSTDKTTSQNIQQFLLSNSKITLFPPVGGKENFSQATAAFNQEFQQSIISYPINIDSQESTSINQKSSKRPNDN